MVPDGDARDVCVGKKIKIGEAKQSKPELVVDESSPSTAVDSNGDDIYN